MNRFYNAKGRVEAWLTAREFASWLYDHYGIPISKRHIAKWAEQGMPHRKIGDDLSYILLFPVVRCLAWLSAQKLKGVIYKGP